MERKRSTRKSGGRHLPRGRHSPENKCKTCCRKFTAFMFSHVGLCALVVGYIILGAFTFRALEKSYNMEKATTVSMMRQDTVNELWQITENLNVLYKENWTAQVSDKIVVFQKKLLDAIRDGYDGRTGGTGQQWSFSSAFLYSLTVITTIGYGNIAPRTPWGKIVTILYAILGIPLMLLYLTNIGDILAKALRYTYGKLCTCRPNDSYRRRRQQHPHQAVENYRVHHIVAHNSPNRHNQNALEPGVQDKLHVPTEDEVHIETIPDDMRVDDGGGSYDSSKTRVPVTLCIIIMVGYVSGGAVLFSLWENWDFLEGFYFCFVTLSTIGFGDYVPGDSVTSDTGDSQEKLAICSLYVLVGMALIAMCFNLMQEQVIYNVRNCGKRIGIIKDLDDDDDMS